MRLLVPVLVSLAACVASATNYPHTDGPRYAGGGPRLDTPARAARGHGRSLTVVTFNIELSARIGLALDELARAGLAGADVIALQEMDAAGVERIARTLGLAWVYYPGSVHRTGRDFGNAILSRWPIEHDRKIILPHPSPVDGRIRTAVAAEIARPEGRFVVYSVHDATVVSSLGDRLDQARAILDDCRERCGRLPVVLAGDYNTSDDRGLYDTAALHARRGFAPATPIWIETADVPVGHSSLDHVFVRGFRVRDFGVGPRLGASDHRAVWVTLAPLRRGADAVRQTAVGTPAFGH